MDQQMREFRVTSCWFGKTVEEVERRRFVKLKSCVLEPAARGFLAIARRCLLKKSIRQRFAFTLKDSADGLCDDLKPAESYSYLESAGALLKDNQQDRSLSLERNQLGPTKNSAVGILARQILKPAESYSYLESAGSVVEFGKKSAWTNEEFSSWNFSKANPAADDLSDAISTATQNSAATRNSAATQASSSPRKS
ncbi:hypothetical protein F511_39565 [Dorcoceras hygrometricum]|uniref:Uncharacterized protein n=1 Tax=Dorcoceras hygrometricum TaxID=472368 RepID=A0A2Z7BFZ6_9LAMI|nr:hypothetical protein F511_39565 [Dorcoceras hygrometricum]